MVLNELTFLDIITHTGFAQLFTEIIKRSWPFKKSWIQRDETLIKLTSFKLNENLPVIINTWFPSLQGWTLLGVTFFKASASLQRVLLQRSKNCWQGRPIFLDHFAHLYPSGRNLHMGRRNTLQKLLCWEGGSLFLAIFHIFITNFELGY